MVLGDIFRLLGVSIAGKIVPAASIFLFSRMMPAADFGVLSLFLSYIWITATLMSLNIYTGVGRVIFYPDVDTRSLIGTSLMMIGAVYAIVWLALLATLHPLTRLLNLPPMTLMLLPIVVAGYVAESFITQVLIFQKKSGLLLTMTAARALTTIAVALLLISNFAEHKYMGVIIAESIAAGGFLLSISVVLRKHVAFRFDRDYAMRLLRYSLPLIAYVVSLTLLSQSDRIMIDRFYGKTETGLYSLTYNFASLMLIGITAVLNAFQPSFFEAMNANDMPQVLSEARTTMVLALAAAFTLVLLGEPISAWLFPLEYSDAFDIIPVVAIGCLGLASFQIWIRVLAFHNRTGLISLVALVAVVVNIALNYWTLEPFGYKAAAYTTLAAQYLMAALCLSTLWYLGFVRDLQATTDLIVATVICCLALTLPMVTAEPALNLAIRLGATIPTLALLASYAWPRLIQAAYGERASNE